MARRVSNCPQKAYSQPNYLRNWILMFFPKNGDIREPFLLSVPECNSSYGLWPRKTQMPQMLKRRKCAKTQIDKNGLFAFPSNAAFLVFSMCPIDRVALPELRQFHLAFSPTKAGCVPPVHNPPASFTTVCKIHTQRNHAQSNKCIHHSCKRPRIHFGLPNIG